jgi:hypothetical protein
MSPHIAGNDKFEFREWFRIFEMMLKRSWKPSFQSQVKKPIMINYIDVLKITFNCVFLMTSTEGKGIFYQCPN